MKIEMKIEGMDHVMDSLQRLPVEVSAKRGGPVARALRKGARVIAEQAKLNLADNVRTGNLRDSVIVTRAKASEQPQFGERYLVRVGNTFLREYVKNVRNIRKGRATQVSAKSYELEEMPALYGRWLEHGTSKQPARPWMGPAFQAKADEAIRVTSAALAADVVRIAERLARKGFRKGR